MHARPGLPVARRQSQPVVWPWAWLLALVLLAQSLGQVHTVLHAATAHGNIGAERLLGRHASEPQVSHWLSRLFADHGNASDCRLYDQVSHGDCMPAAAPLPPAAMPGPVWAAQFPTSAPVRLTLRPQARGPPVQG